MDFYQIRVKEKKGSPPELYPDWVVGRSKDLMVRGRSFYAVWDEARGLWSTDEYDVQRLVDEDLHREAKELKEKTGISYRVMNLRSFDTQIWTTFRRYMQNISDNSHTLDEKLVFADDEVKKTDYVSRRLPYALEEGSCDAWNELLGVLYSDEERAKIEWAIGSIVSGDSKKIQKFFVLYGPGGTGKSTVLNIIELLFDGYVATFDAKALGSNNNAFATEIFKSNPLVAIQHDGDLSKIDDNTKLNSIISHEMMTMNEKYKATYAARVNAMLFMGTNQPVRISDAKSGIIRRLIDIHPTGLLVEEKHYHKLMHQIEFELGAIAHHCLQRYLEMGRNFYSSYRPIEMMLQTDVFYNYVEACYDVFKKQNGVTLKQAWELYKEYCADTGIVKMLPVYKFREELRNYFEKFEARAEVRGERVSSYYSGFKSLVPPSPFKPHVSPLELKEQLSYFDTFYPDLPAQYARPSGTPEQAWSKVTTVLGDIDTSQLHWVRVPTNHIVIDFDLVDEDGEKSLEKNLEAASEWPPTYAELSKSGAGLHLHYIYSGDVTELSSIYDVGIEVKTLLGDGALRRKLTRCNSLEIATISSGIPKKEKSAVLETKSIKSEKGLRELIARNLRKEIHPGTKPSIDFIWKILEDAYNSGMAYDVRDMRKDILTFAARSTNQALACIKIVEKMHFFSESAMPAPVDNASDPLVFFDIEMYPNLFVVCWKYAGDANVVRMVNPTAQQIEKLLSMKLVGFNNRRYDNHVLYACFLGYPLEELYKLSKRIIDGFDSALFQEAFNVSYTDIYEFSSKKQSLKKFQIELGIHHMELDLPWDEPVPEDKWQLVIDYCANDVISSEAVFEDRKQDFVARQILAELSGLSVNHTTNQHTARIIFGQEKFPQKDFVYTDLSTQFKGYKFDGKASTYRGEVTGEGGYVYAEPGIYENVAVLDVASMHPASIEALELFGPHTKNFSALKEARVAIKRKQFDKARQLLGDRVSAFIAGAEQDPTAAASLSYALKIAINSVYGLTSARFPNAFRDNRNLDNIVAKRGALFMIDLKHEVQKRGFTVVHIKTDSIKIPDATPEIIAFVSEFGQKYGYEFEHEVTYDKFCLVNDAVYIAKAGDEWTAVGAQFQHPYVFKTLFTGEDLTFDDFCETKSVTQGSMYLNFKDISNDPPVREELIHVGRCGSFVPVKEGGGVLWRIKDGKHYAVTGTKGYLWIEREMALARADKNSVDLYDIGIDMSYFDKLREDAEAAIDYYGSFERFVS